MTADRTLDDSPATLVAIVVAAKRAGDRELEREARRLLSERFGVKVTFEANRPSKEPANAR